jgi:transcriptional regulator with XRE-family HTH domain
VRQLQTEENKKIMARNIKRYMEQKGVTNQQLCEDLGFKYTTFIDWIKAVTYPRIGKIEAMADYFGILKSDLIEEKMTEEKEKDNDLLAEIIVRMRMDEEFKSLVESLYLLDSDKIQGVKQLLQAFAK